MPWLWGCQRERRKEGKKERKRHRTTATYSKVDGLSLDNMRSHKILIPVAHGSHASSGRLLHQALHRLDVLFLLRVAQIAPVCIAPARLFLVRYIYDPERKKKAPLLLSCTRDIMKRTIPCAHTAFRRHPDRNDRASLSPRRRWRGGPRGRQSRIQQPCFFSFLLQVLPRSGMGITRVNGKRGTGSGRS